MNTALNTQLLDCSMDDLQHPPKSTISIGIQTEIRTKTTANAYTQTVGIQKETIIKTESEACTQTEMKDIVAHLRIMHQYINQLKPKISVGVQTDDLRNKLQGVSKSMSKMKRKKYSDDAYDISN